MAVFTPNSNKSSHDRLLNYSRTPEEQCRCNFLVSSIEFSFTEASCCCVAVRIIILSWLVHHIRCKFQASFLGEYRPWLQDNNNNNDNNNTNTYNKYVPRSTGNNEYLPAEKYQQWMLTVWNRRSKGISSIVCSKRCLFICLFVCVSVYIYIYMCVCVCVCVCVCERERED